MHTNHPTSSRSAPLPVSITLLITVCFFLSGVAALIYEVVWARQLSLFLGITSFAHTAVITAYMAGLASGSLYFGRRADLHPQPLKLYAWLEIGVGLYAALTPWLFTSLQNAYVNFADVSNIGAMSGHLTRFTIALIALLIPTFLMGGTLPLLVRGFITELPALGKVTSRFYGINTLGAMIGTLLAGYLLLPRLGVKASIFVGVIINLGVAVIVLAMLRRLKHQPKVNGQVAVAIEPPQVESGEAMPISLRFVLLMGFGTAGFAALLTQMAWIRALILVVGGSVYAFTITLASFLTGIGLGSLVYLRYLARPNGWLTGSWLQERMVQAAVLSLLIGLFLLPGLPLIGKMPGWFLAAYQAGLQNNFHLFQLFIFALSFSVMILPTLLMGVLFPLVTVIWTRNINRAGSGVGTAYAINTTGTILGALLGGLYILPWLGVQHSIFLATGLYVLVAIAFWLYSGISMRLVHRYTISVAAILLSVMIAWLLPSWNKAMMISGVFVFPQRLIMQLPGKSLQQVVDREELLYYEEGLDGIVAVRKDGENRVLVINGKMDASNINDLPTQILLAQLPLAVKPAAESALVIGLGSGITAGSLAASKSLQALTILEISAEVAEAAEFFARENYDVLHDPRVELVTADARNYLMASPGVYDLIVSEPSNPWISGVSNLFTDEFFKLAKSRLNPGGVMTQWIHTYGMSNNDLRTIFKTFDENFRYVSVWAPLFDDLIIVGTDEPHTISLAQTGDPLDATRAAELKRGQVYDDRDLVRQYVFGDELLSRYAGDAVINSDNNPVIEFSAPRNLYASTARQNMSSIFEYLEGRKEPVPVADMVKQGSDYLDARFMHLRIARREGLAVTELKSDWLVSQLLQEDKGTRIYGVIGSERMLSWREGSADFHIKATWSQNTPNSNDLLKMVNNLSGPSGRQGGLINLEDEVPAVWMMSANRENRQLHLNIAWDCPAMPDGFTHFETHVDMPDPGQESWGGVLNGLTGRFSCY